MLLDDESLVDLYEVLEVEPATDAAILRKRISEQYLEARENLNHQNHRKRFYFRELYEIHLPQARLVLLDADKRAAYDEQLKAFHSQNKKPAAQRKTSDDAPAAKSAAAPQSDADDDAFAEFADVGNDALPPPVAPNFRMDRAEVEKRRDVKRRELIKHEIIANGYKAGSAAAVIVMLSFVLILTLFNSLLSGGIVAATGLSLVVFLVICAVLSGVAAAFAARQAMRWARQKTVGYLSTLPYDELLRHCAG